MPITSITIENFKGIGEKAVTIPIRPITLLFGKNSSGKSTVLQAMRYFFHISTEQIIKQIIEQNSIEMSGGYTIDLSDFPSLIHRHELDRKIRIRLKEASAISDSDTQIYSWMEVVTGWKGGRTHVESILQGWDMNGEEMCFIVSGTTPNDAVIGSNGKELIRREDFLEDSPSEIYVTANPTKDFKDFMKTIFSEKRKPKKLDASNSSVGVGVVLPASLAGVIIGTVISVLKARRSKKRHIQESKKLDAMRHLGPFREVPPREYERPQTPNESQWQKGLGAWDALARDPKLLEKTNHYLKEVLQLGYTIKQPEPDQNFQLYDENNQIDVGLSDVGVGVAQIIPVVVGALDSSSITFAVEQPELHVHPAVQVALGDLFIDAIKLRDHRTMLIETHSEHLLLRIMRRMRETFENRIEENRFPVTPDDIAVLFVESHDSRTIIREMPVNERGELVENWPDGFFGEYIEEVF